MATQVKTDLIANNAITDAKIANVAITGVTASSGDSSTSLATTAFVAGEINSLIDAAPGALNTLNELAAALGDDANFSTTVTNSIATKAPLDSPVFSSTYTSGQDETLAEFRRDGGAVAAKIIYADATTDMEFGTTTSHALSLTTADTRRLTIDSAGKVGIGTSTLNKFFNLADPNNGGEENKLHFEATGVTHWAIYPYDRVNNHYPSLHLGQNENLKILNTGAVQIGNASDGILFQAKPSDGRVGIKTTSPEGLLHIEKGSSGSTYSADAADNLILENNSSMMMDIRTPTGNTGGILFSDADARGRGVIQYAHSNDSMYINTAGVNRMVIDSSGLVHMNGSTGSFGTPSFTDGILFTYKDDNEPHIENKVNHTNSFGLYKFINSNGSAGSISMYSTSVSYNTSSDYRLKEDVNYTWDATSKLKQLKPCEFKFKADSDGVVHQGFLAHEVDDIVPTSVFGEKDGEEMQQLDHSKLVPLLVKTIQELEARIKTLEE